MDKIQWFEQIGIKNNFYLFYFLDDSSWEMAVSSDFSSSEDEWSPDITLESSVFGLESEGLVETFTSTFKFEGGSSDIFSFFGILYRKWNTNFTV